MVHFDRKNCQNQAKNLSYKTGFGAKWTWGQKTTVIVYESDSMTNNIILGLYTAPLWSYIFCKIWFLLLFKDHLFYALKAVYFDSIFLNKYLKIFFEPIVLYFARPYFFLKNRIFNFLNRIFHHNIVMDDDHGYWIFVIQES